jgi:hypothetical protein
VTSWTERRDHLSVAPANALLKWLLSQGHLLPQPHGRALRLSTVGEQYFRGSFGIGLPDDVPSGDELADPGHEARR